VKLEAYFILKVTPENAARLFDVMTSRLTKSLATKKN